MTDKKTDDSSNMPASAVSRVPDDKALRVAKMIDGARGLINTCNRLAEFAAILRREYGELETHLAATESYLDGLRGDIVKYCPVRTGSEHGETEFLIHWRKQWDKLEAKLAKVRKELVRARRQLALKDWLRTDEALFLAIREINDD